jgi:hypothetical protein
MLAPRACARISALLICGTGMVGAGLGTLLVGLANDYLFRTSGGVVFSLALVAGAGGLASAAVLARGCGPMRARGPGRE